MSKVVDLYTIQIVDELPKAPPVARDRLVHPDALAALMAEAEENINDLLPYGYHARVRKWDDLEEGDNPDE